MLDLCLHLLSDYRYYLTMVLKIKEKVYINVKEEEQKEQRAGKITPKKWLPLITTAQDRSI